jgi:hypothetical protein
LGLCRQSGSTSVGFIVANLAPLCHFGNKIFHRFKITPDRCCEKACDAAALLERLITEPKKLEIATVARSDERRKQSEGDTTRYNFPPAQQDGVPGRAMA